MLVLISPVSYEEAASIVDTGVDIIDIKNVNEGSLGAQFPWHTRGVAELCRVHGTKASATLGDLPYKPGTAALAAYGAAQCGVTYIKAGLHGLNTYEQACDVMEAVRLAVRMVSEKIDVVAAGYADYRQFNGLSTHDLVRAARGTRGFAQIGARGCASRSQARHHRRAWRSLRGERSQDPHFA